MKSNREISLDKIEKLTDELTDYLDDYIKIFINLNKSSCTPSEVYSCIATGGFLFFVNVIKNIVNNLVTKKDIDDFLKKMKNSVVTMIDVLILENKIKRNKNE